MNTPKNIVVLIGVVAALFMVWRGLLVLKKRGIVHVDVHNVAHLPNPAPRRYVTIADLNVAKSGDGTSVKYHGFTGETTLNLLRLISPSGVETIDIPDAGTFIKSIDGRTADQTHYWALYVNNHIATSSPDMLITNDNDIIEWKYESL